MPLNDHCIFLFRGHALLPFTSVQCTHSVHVSCTSRLAPFNNHLLLLYPPLHFLFNCYDPFINASGLTLLSADNPGSPLPLLASSSKAHLHTVPTATFTAQVDPNEVLIPVKIIRILRSGWMDHIPLDAITNDACRLAASQASRNSDHGLTMNADGRIISKATLLDTSKEDKITISDWYQASRNLVYAIRQFLLAGGDDKPGGPNAKAISAVFGKHFVTLQMRADFEASFATYRDYDINIRRRYVNGSSSFNPGIFQQSLYESIERTHFAAERAALQVEHAAVKSLLAQKSSSGGSSRQSNSSSSKTYTYQGSFQPRTDNGWKAKAGGHSFRASSSGSSNNACMFCGSRDHKYSLHSGPAKFLKKDPGGIWRDDASRTYCVNFNGPFPCPRGSSCPHAHACSLCGTGSHSAQSHDL